MSRARVTPSRSPSPLGASLLRGGDRGASAIGGGLRPLSRVATLAVFTCSIGSGAFFGCGAPPSRGAASGSASVASSAEPSRAAVAGSASPSGASLRADGPPSSAILGIGAPEVGGAIAAAPPSPSMTSGAGSDGSGTSTVTEERPKSASAKGDKNARITARHILVQWMGCDHAAPSVVRTRDQAHVVIEEVLRRAKAGEDFARLAVEYSDEPNAGARGGSLGRFGHGQMVKPFEDAAFALAPGEISDIIETPFGFHVIQRLE